MGALTISGYEVVGNQDFIRELAIFGSSVGRVFMGSPGVKERMRLDLLTMKFICYGYCTRRDAWVGRRNSRTFALITKDRHTRTAYGLPTDYESLLVTLKLRKQHLLGAGYEVQVPLSLASPLPDLWVWNTVTMSYLSNSISKY